MAADSRISGQAAMVSRIRRLTARAVATALVAGWFLRDVITGVPAAIERADPVVATILLTSAMFLGLAPVAERLVNGERVGVRPNEAILLPLMAVFGPGPGAFLATAIDLISSVMRRHLTERVEPQPSPARWSKLTVSTIVLAVVPAVLIAMAWTLLPAGFAPVTRATIALVVGCLLSAPANGWFLLIVGAYAQTGVVPAVDARAWRRATREVLVAMLTVGTFGVVGTAVALHGDLAGLLLMQGILYGVNRLATSEARARARREALEALIHLQMASGDSMPALPDVVATAASALSSSALATSERISDRPSADPMEINVDIGGTPQQWIVLGRPAGTLPYRNDTRVELDSLGRLAARAIGMARFAEEATHAAQTDQLTGLHNRVGLRGALQDSGARDVPAALFYIDLDRFKPINDIHGHAAGDEVLQIVATRLRRAVRSSDVVARLGGDEFVVVSRDITPGELPGVAANIRATLVKPMHVPAAGTTLTVDASIGAVTAPWSEVGPRLDGLLQTADQRMYAQKAGRGG